MRLITHKHKQVYTYTKKKIERCEERGAATQNIWIKLTLQRKKKDLQKKKKTIGYTQTQTPK